MNSKKLGMIAAAALTVVTAQANAEAKKVKAGEPMVCEGSCAPSCAGKLNDKAKDKDACAAAKGTWMTKAAFEEKQKKAKGGDTHKH